MEPDPDDRWLARDPLPPEPLAVADAWLRQAFEAGRQPNPHAVALATREPDGRPGVRMVLCKRIEPDAGAIVFYTDRTSAKARALAAHPVAAVAFHFNDAGRQVRVEGHIAPTDDADSDAYFASRPRETQLAAWASHQSQPLATREALEAALAEVVSRHPPAAPVPRPPDWGGYRLLADRVELWRSRPARLHDRARWSRELDPVPGPWRIERLQP